MARMRVFMVLVLALTAGGVLAFGTYNYVQKMPPARSRCRRGRWSSPPRTWTSARSCRGTTSASIEWPAELRCRRTRFTDPNEVIGRGLILPVIQNEPILPMKLASKEAGAGLPPAIPPGLRAVSVRVNEVIGVAGYVLPGTRVDVVVTVSPTQQNADMTAKVILTNVQVLPPARRWSATPKRASRWR